MWKYAMNNSVWNMVSGEECVENRQQLRSVSSISCISTREKCYCSSLNECKYQQISDFCRRIQFTRFLRSQNKPHTNRNTWTQSRFRETYRVTSIIVIKLLLFLKWIYFPVTLMSVSLEYQFIYTSTWINLILHSLMKCISAFVCTRRRPPCAWGRIWSSSVNRMGMEHDVPSVNVFVYVN